MVLDSADAEGEGGSNGHIMVAAADAADGNAVDCGKHVDAAVNENGDDLISKFIDVGCIEIDFELNNVW